MMKCSNCGFDVAQNDLFCPHCGQRLIYAAEPCHAAADRILPVLKDPLFLVVCILLSASCLLSLTFGSMPLINVLITIFLWLTYAQAQKDIADANHLRCVSGALYAQYVIYYVSAVLVLVMGILFAIAFNILSSASILEALMAALAGEGLYVPLLSMLPSIPGTVILVICALISVVMILVNIFTTRYLHRFVKSVYKSLEADALSLQHTGAAQTILFILGGFHAVGALSSLASADFITFLSSGATGACAIVGGLLIRKYLNYSAPVAE